MYLHPLDHHARSRSLTQSPTFANTRAHGASKSASVITISLKHNAIKGASEGCAGASREALREVAMAEVYCGWWKKRGIFGYFRFYLELTSPTQE